ncbi:MAG: PAS domain S-box protein, partial [Nitrospirota bacterium]
AFCEEYRVQRKDGSYMWILDRGVALWAEDGTPVRMAGSETDITTRKQAEETLQRTQFAMDSAADAIYWIDPAAHILYANDAASEMLGYSLGELRTMTVHDLNPDFQADQWPGFWAETQQRKSMTFETFHRAKPGHLIPIEIQIKFLAHDGQEFHCVFVRDISERKRAEQALGEQARLAGFVAAVSLAINQNQPVDEMLDRCIAMTIQHLGAAFVRIWTIEPRDACGNCARVEACTDQTPCSYLHTNDELSTSLHGESRQAPLGILKIGQIAQEMGTVWTNDVLHDDRLPDKQWMQENGLRSFAGIPLIVEGRVFGILGRFGTTPLSEPMVRTLESVCHGMAAAIARKLMAEDLRRSKAQLSDIMENNPAVVYTRRIGDEWPFTFVTPNIFGLLGYTSIDLISDAGLWDRLMHPDDLMEMMAQALPSFLRKGAQTFVARFRHRDGQYRWIENQARLTHLGDGPLLMVGTMTDITERIRAEEALRESEERFALAVEGSNDILWDAHLLPGEPWYAPQTLIWWSPRVRELLGLEETESFETLEQWATRLHPDDKDRVFGQLAAHLEHRVPYDAEYRLRTNRGNYRWIRGRGQGIWDEQGDPRRMSGSCQDITERKLAEQALQLSELHVKSIVEASPECIKLMATDGTLLQMNAAGLAMIEAERAEDVIGKCVYPHIAPEYRDRFRALNESVCQGTKESLEFELEGAQGTRRWMETHAVPLRNPTDGSVVHLAITRDITKRKQAEEALRVSEERFRAVVESSTNGLVMVDGDGRIALLNREIERLFGYRREALLGQPIEALIPPRFRGHHPSLRAAYQKNTETMMLVRGRNLYGLRQDGGEFPVEIGLSPIETGNGPMTLASVMDLTERTRAEDKQKQLLAELAESQKHFEQIFHWTPSAVAISTLAEGRFLDVNDRLVQLTGYSREELIGHTTDELRLWADPPERARVIQEILQQRSLHNKEGLLRTKSGELRTIMISVDRIQVKATPCLIYVAHDITERKQAEITQARQYEALQAIFRMTVALSRASSLEELYEQGIDGVQRALKVDRASILLFDEDGVMRFKASRGLSEEYKMAVEGHSPWSRETVNPQPMLVEDVVADPSVAPYRAIFVGEGIAALGFIPLVSSEGLLGKFMLYYDTPHQFTEEEIQIAQTIASHVALMIQRKRAVARLRHSERQLRTVLDSLPIGVWFTDRTGKTLLANPAAKQIWSNIKHVGLQTQDNPSGWWETLEPVNEPHRWALGHALTTGKPSLNETLDLEGLDGGKKTIRNTTVPVRDESGTVLGAVILNEDLTEIRRVQEALKLTQFSVDHAVEGFFWIGPDARILTVNDAACRMLEYSREELMAMTLHDIDPHFPPELWPAHWEELKQKGSVALESKQWSKTGRVLDVEITVSYLRYTDREYHCAIMRDIGERKKAQCALRESEDRLQRALEASGAGTWRVDLHTGLDTRDTGLNRLLGLPAETTVQPVDEWFTFLHPDDRSAMEAAWQSASINGLYEVEHRLIRRDGAIRWVYDRGRFVRDEVGQPLYATGAVIDITERKRVEETLRQHERDLRAAIDERERISQDLHDGILQSLYAIGLGLEACKSLQQQQQQQQQQQCKKTAKAITQALDQAVGQLNTVMGEVRNFIAGLDSDILQSGKFSIALRAMIQMLVANHPMRCHLAIDETAVCRLSTEQALHMMNIVREAISNSLRHGHATKATVSLKPLARSIRLTIRDNGKGFEPADAHSLGHGLSNMRARAKKMGGHFTIQSAPDRGTRVTIDLPQETCHDNVENQTDSTAARR